MSKDKIITLPDKLSLIEHPYIRLMIKELRKENRENYTAQELSLKIGKSKSWLAQIENGRLNSISKSDLLLIVKKLTTVPIYGSTEEEVIFAMQYYESEYENIKIRELEEEQSKLPVSKEVLLKREVARIFFEIKDSLFKNFDNLNSDEKEKLLISLETLNKNVNSNLNLTATILSLPIHAINKIEKNADNTKKFVSDLNNAFTNYLSSTLNND